MDNLSALSTCLNYTFTTIAQTLAGIIGLVSGFVIFKQGKLMQVMDDNFQSVNDPNSTYFIDSRYREILNEYEEILSAESSGHGQGSGFDHMKFEKFKKAFLKKEKIEDSIKFALALSIATIIYSVLVIAMVPKILLYGDVFYWVLALGFILFLSSLYLIFKLILKSI